MDRQIERNLTSTQTDVSLYYLNQNPSNYLPDDGLTDQSLNEVVVFTLMNPQYQ